LSFSKRNSSLALTGAEDRLLCTPAPKGAEQWELIGVLVRLGWLSFLKRNSLSWLTGKEDWLRCLPAPKGVGGEERLVNE
jgi:hypothetical protein